MNPISPDIVSALPAAQMRDRFINEAAFGYRYIAPHLKALPSGSRVLEIGSGPSILLAQLAKDFPQVQFTGVEPVASGFEFYADSIKAMQKSYPFNLHSGGYETFHAPQPFDLIFMVNVFHHLPDWRHFLGFLKSCLTPGGKCLILGPNYGFPYDPHFAIPTLWNKRLTYFLLQKHIHTFEASHNRTGLWDSLNFVTWAQIRREASRQGFEITNNPSILTDMVDRFDNDLEFARRQRLLSRAAKFLKWSRLLALLRLRIFWRIHPYLFLEITRK